MAEDERTPKQKILDSLSNSINLCLDKKGITLDYLADKLKEELDAFDTKVFQYQGEVITKDDLIAWEIRQKARQDAHKLRGDYPAEKKSHTFEGGIPVRPLTPKQQARLEAIEKVLEEEEE